MWDPVCPIIFTKGSLHPGLVLIRAGAGTGLMTQSGREQPLALMREAA